MNLCKVYIVIVVHQISMVAAQHGSCPTKDQLYPSLLGSKSCDTGSVCPFEERNPWLETSSLEGNGILQRHCMCDRLCLVYGDCCKDVYSQLDAGKNPHWKDGRTDLPILPKGTFSCQTSSILQSGKHVYVVDQCPSEWVDGGIKEQCETLHAFSNETFLKWPVSDRHGILYKNMYCAICHQAQRFLYWRVEIECLDMLEELGKENSKDEFHIHLTQWLESGMCQMKFDPPTNATSFRPCKSIVGTCAYDWADDKCDTRQKCEYGYHHYVYTPSKSHSAYKNQYCARCNSEDAVLCYDGMFKVLLTRFNAFPHFYPLSMVFDVNPGSGGISVGQGASSFINNTVSEMKACGEDKVYDPFQGICRSLFCTAGFAMQEGQCIQINNNLPVFDSPDVNLNIGHIQDCPRISLNQSEFVIDKNGTLHVLDSSILHPEGTYAITPEDTALVCTDFSQNYTLTTVLQKEEINLKFSSVQTILTVVGQIISMIGLLIQLFVYSLFPKLRNLAGRNLMCLSAALLCGQLFFLTGSSAAKQYGACAFLAILTHYAFLVSFAWMNIMAYSIWKTFANTSKQTTLGHQSRKFPKYCLFGWGAPLVFILVAIIVNYTTSDTYFRPGYGETICWIRYRPALLIYFAAPVALVVVINLVFYILTIISIWKISKLAKTVTKKSDKDLLWLYIKLSSIMGLTWIFGLVAAIFDSQTLWYFFIIFNSLQGAFICISFVFTKKVYKMMRDKLHPVYMALSTSGNTTTNTSLSESERNLSEMARRVSETPRRYSETPRRISESKPLYEGNGISENEQESYRAKRTTKASTGNIYC